MRSTYYSLLASTQMGDRHNCDRLCAIAPRTTMDPRHRHNGILMDMTCRRLREQQRKQQRPRSSGAEAQSLHQEQQQSNNRGKQNKSSYCEAQESRGSLDFNKCLTTPSTFQYTLYTTVRNQRGGPSRKSPLDVHKIRRLERDHKTGQQL